MSLRSIAVAVSLLCIVLSLVACGGSSAPATRAGLTTRTPVAVASAVATTDSLPGSVDPVYAAWANAIWPVMRALPRGSPSNSGNFARIICES